jgi:hypothetical protein
VEALITQGRALLGVARPRAADGGGRLLDVVLRRFVLGEGRLLGVVPTHSGALGT